MLMAVIAGRGCVEASDPAYKAKGRLRMRCTATLPYSSPAVPLPTGLWGACACAAQHGVVKDMLAVATLGGVSATVSMQHFQKNMHGPLQRSIGILECDGRTGVSSRQATCHHACAVCMAHAQWVMTS